MEWLCFVNSPLLPLQADLLRTAMSECPQAQVESFLQCCHRPQLARRLAKKKVQVWSVRPFFFFPSEGMFVALNLLEKLVFCVTQLATFNTEILRNFDFTGQLHIKKKHVSTCNVGKNTDSLKTPWIICEDSVMKDSAWRNDSQRWILVSALREVMHWSQKKLSLSLILLLSAVCVLGEKYLPCMGLCCGRNDPGMPKQNTEHLI